jgi:hypothetical protein
MSRDAPAPRSLCCTNDELRELSGGRVPKTVCRWLDMQRIRYVTGLDGWPRVPREAMLAHIGATAPGSACHEPRMRLP